jgi:hypothetical protein
MASMIKILRITLFIILMVLTLVGDNFEIAVFDVSIEYIRERLGLNLPVTPFTADMTLFSTTDKGNPFYQAQFELSVSDESGHVQNLAWNRFSVYSLKQALHWHVEYLSYGQDPPWELLKFICNSIENEIAAKPLWWRVDLVSNSVKINSKEFGVGKTNLCIN